MNIQDWTLYYDNFGPLSCQAPCTMYSVLYDHGKIPDPFYGTNERELQYLAEKDCVFESVFSAPPALLTREHIELVFHGLDTICHIYLNGTLLGKVKNMHREYVYEVKPLLTAGGNTLRLEFKSPRRYFAQQQHKHYLYMNDGDTLPGAAHLRKAMYQSGWDWGPTLPDMGIFRGVELKGWNVDRFDGVAVRQHHENGSVSVELDVTTKCHAGCEIYADFDGKRVLLKNGHGIIQVDNPKLWWARGYGDQPLYDLDVELVCGGEVIDRCHKQLGLRTLTVSTEPDADGKGSEFCFVLNGVKIFSMGANLVPMDNLLSRITDQRWETIVRQAVDANFNTLRVWGGGYYPDSRFYELCDQYGLLVWQDFMFACTTYPHDPAFLRRVEAEAEYNIHRLRNHASLAMWCGNNEIYEGIRYWGWEEKYSSEVYQQMQEGYDVLFRQLLPQKVKEFDPGRFYLEGSPLEANWGRPESWKVGDSHNWGTWYGQKPFESLDKEIPRFMSEYGFQAFPEMKTIRTFASPEDYELESPVMNAHQKSTIGNALIKKTMSLYYPVPEKFEDLVYVGLVLQGHGMRRGMVAHRRNRPYCMGSLPWQLNDSWPVVSWSAIDYYGNWKAMQYHTRRAFAPVLVDAIRQGDKLRFYVLSDCLQTENVTLHLALTDFQGRVMRRHRVEGMLPVNASEVFFEEDWQKAFEGCDTTASFIRMTLRGADGKKVLSDEVFYPVYPKEQRLPRAEIACRKVKKGGVVELTLKSRVLARDVFVEVPLQGARFSDNFFDLLPGETKRITVSSADGSPLEDVSVVIHQLADVRE